MITYSSNFMGPVSKEWYKKRGLSKHITKTIETEKQSKIWHKPIGYTYVVDEITTYYAGGRIDIRDDSKEGYDGWDEYAVMPMHGEDWNALSEWLDELQTETIIPYQELIAQFELNYGKKIRWADDTE